jgi:hypothetical protein
MANIITMGQINDASHLDVFAPTTPGGLDLVRLEVYAGQVSVGLKGGDQVNHQDFKMFLPVRGRNTIRLYETDIKERAVLVCPEGFLIEDTEGLVSVDLAFVVMEQSPQSASLTTLVLHFSLGVLRGEAIRVAYHVTVTTQGDVPFDTLELRDDEGPDPGPGDDDQPGGQGDHYS